MEHLVEVMVPILFSYRDGKIFVDVPRRQRQHALEVRELRRPCRARPTATRLYGFECTRRRTKRPRRDRCDRARRRATAGIVHVAPEGLDGPSPSRNGDRRGGVLAIIPDFVKGVVRGPSVVERI